MIMDDYGGGRGGQNRLKFVLRNMWTVPKCGEKFVRENYIDNFIHL